jgi:hypothetical protein
VEKRTAVDFHLPAAQAPIRPQNKMIPEYGMFEIVEIPSADQTEIGNIFLVQSGKSFSGVFTFAGNQTYRAHEFLVRDTRAESRVAGAKYGTQYAIARRGTASANGLDPRPLAGCAELLRQPYCF